MVLFVMLHVVVLTFKSADEIPVCNHLNNSYSAVFHVVFAFHYDVHGGYNAYICE